MQYTAAVTWPAEQGRVALVICQTCGVAILLDSEVDTMVIHDGWHDRLESRIYELEARHEYDSMHGPGGS